MTSKESVRGAVTYKNQKVKKTGLATAAVFAFLVGTGGEASPDYLAQRNERGYRFSEIKSPKPNLRASNLPSFAQHLEFIKRTFGTSVSGLASVFGVSRQTIYDWQNGAVAAEHSQSKLNDLLAAANVLVGSGVNTSGPIAKRVIREGKSLLEICRDGGSAITTARSLVDIIQREHKQRQVLSARLSGRVSNSNDDDFGSPSMNENG